MAKKTRAKSEITRKALLDATLTVIGRHGYAGATIEKIAEEAGVSKGVVYYYFDTKADIATSVLIDTFQKVVASFEAIVAEGGTPYESMAAFVRSFAHMIFANREASRFVLNEIWRNDRIWSDEMREIEERLIRLFESLLDQGVQDGSLRPEIDRRFIAVAVTGTVLISAQYYLMQDDEACEEGFSDHCIDFIHHALAAR